MALKLKNQSSYYTMRPEPLGEGAPTAVELKKSINLLYHTGTIHS